MTLFDDKTWVDAPDGYKQGVDPLPVGATPLDADGLNDLEARIKSAAIQQDAGGYYIEVD